MKTDLKELRQYGHVHDLQHEFYCDLHPYYKLSKDERSAIIDVMIYTRRTYKI